MSACATHIARITQVTLKTINSTLRILQLVALFPSHLVLVQFFGSQTRLTSTFLRKVDDGNRKQWNAPISRYPGAESIATNRDKGLLLLYHSHAHNRYKIFLLIMRTMLDRAHDLSSSWTHFPTNVTVWKQCSYGIPNILLILPSKVSS